MYRLSLHLTLDFQFHIFLSNGGDLQQIKIKNIRY
jgi:hypothetical protein